MNPKESESLTSDREIEEVESPNAGSAAQCNCRSYLLSKYEGFNAQANRKLKDAPIKEADEEIQKAFGGAILKMARRPEVQDWITRRREVVQVLNERTLVRTGHFDIDLAGLRSDIHAPSKEGKWVLPVQRLSRKIHTSITSFDNEGRALERWGFQAERSAVFSGLIARWRPSLDDQHLEIVWFLLTEPIRFESSSHMDSLDIGSQLIFELVHCRVEANQLSQNDEVALARDLLRWHHNYLLLVQLTNTTQQFSIILSLNESVPPRSALSTSLTWLKKFVYRIPRWIGGSFSIGFSIPMRHVVGGAKSTHVELQAPSGFRVVGAGVFVEYFEPIIELHEDSQEERLAQINKLSESFGRTVGPHQILRDDDDVPESAHVFIRNLPLDVKNASLNVGLYAYRTGFIIQALVSSWLVFILTDIYYQRVAHYDFAVSSAFRSSSSAFAAAIIPMFAGAVIAVLTQQDSSRIASSCLAVPRALLTASATCLMAVAPLLAFGDGSLDGFPIWTVLLWATFAIAIKMTLGFSVHSFRTNQYRRRLAQQFWNIRDNDDNEKLLAIHQLWKHPHETFVDATPHRRQIGKSVRHKIEGKLIEYIVTFKRQHPNRRLPSVTDIETEIISNSSIADALREHSAQRSGEAFERK